MTMDQDSVGVKRNLVAANAPVLAVLAVLAVLDVRQHQADTDSTGFCLYNLVS